MLQYKTHRADSRVLIKSRVHADSFWLNSSIYSSDISNYTYSSETVESHQRQFSKSQITCIGEKFS